MIRLPLVIFALVYFPDPSPATTLADKLDKLYEKLERLTVPPPSLSSRQDLSDRTGQHYAKVENNIGLEDWPEDILTDDEEEILSAVEAWGGMSPGQRANLIKELQELRSERQSDVLDKNSLTEKLAEGIDEDVADDAWHDEELQDLTSLDYAMDAEESEDSWDADEEPMSSTDAAKRGQQTSGLKSSAIDPAAATVERPKILDDSSLTPVERFAVRRAALNHMSGAVRASKCLQPQPRWLAVRQLAPAADTVYMPPCVMLHRCAADTGCCSNEADVCAPVAGEHVAIPLYLNKADGNLTVARMLFYNHTRCACVLCDGEGQRDAARTRTEPPRLIEDPQSPPPPYLSLLGVTEPHTAPPQLRRCTCPTLFLPRTRSNDECVCTCGWAELGRRRECLSLARGREHFGIRDRRCVTRTQCSPPVCEYGPYERATGRCPPRQRRLRTRYQKTIQT